VCKQAAQVPVIFEPPCICIYTVWSKSLYAPDDYSTIIRCTEAFWSPCMYICIKHADQPTKQSATPYRLFHVASVEPLWLKMTHFINMQDALCGITESIV